MNAAQASRFLEAIGDAPGAIAGIRRLAVGLAIGGKLGGEPSADLAALLEALRAPSPARTIAAGITPDDIPRELGQSERFVRLGAVARIEKGRTGIQAAVPGPYPLVVTAEQRLSCDHFDFEGEAAIVPLVSSTGHGEASIQRLHYQQGRFALGKILAAIFPHRPDLLSPRFLFEYLSTFKDELLVSRMIGTANVTLTISKLSDVPVPLVGVTAQARVDELMAFCDQLEVARAEREAARDRLVSASLARLNAPDPANFESDARFVLDALPALTARPDQIGQFRQTIVDLAVQGKLVPQDPNDEPSSELLKRIAAGKAERKLKTGDARIKPAPSPLRAAVPIKLPHGWSAQSFENLFLFIDYRGNTPAKTESGIPLITAKNIRMGHLNREPREYISESTYAAWMTRGFPEPGDLFFTTEAPLANVCLNDLDEPFALAQRAICFQPYGELDTKFIMFALMSGPMQSLIDAHATGMTARGIKAANLKPLPIPIPPLAEQHRIVAKVDKLMAFCDQVEASLAAAETLRGRLLDALLAEALIPIVQDEAA